MSEQKAEGVEISIDEPPPAEIKEDSQSQGEFPELHLFAPFNSVYLLQTRMMAQLVTLVIVRLLLLVVMERERA